MKKTLLPLAFLGLTLTTSAMVADPFPPPPAAAFTFKNESYRAVLVNFVDLSPSSASGLPLPTAPTLVYPFQTVQFSSAEVAGAYSVSACWVDKKNYADNGCNWPLVYPEVTCTGTSTSGPSAMTIIGDYRLIGKNPPFTPVYSCTYIST